MQTASSRIWTRVVVSISYDDNRYTMRVSKKASFYVALTWYDTNNRRSQNIYPSQFEHVFRSLYKICTDVDRAMIANWLSSFFWSGCWLGNFLSIIFYPFQLIRSGSQASTFWEKYIYTFTLISCVNFNLYTPFFFFFFFCVDTWCI